jgi:hypothetical protein
LDDESGSTSADDDLLVFDCFKVLFVVSVVVNDVMDFVFKASKLFGKLVEVDETDALDSGKVLSLMTLEVILEDDVLSQEMLVNTEGTQVTQDFKSEGELMSSAVNNWSVLNTCLGSVEPGHKDGSDYRIHIGGGVSKDNILDDWAVLFSGDLEVSFELVHCNLK